MFFFFLMISCTSHDKDTADTSNISDTNDILPSYTEPQSFTLNVTGASSHTLSFSEHDCSNNNNQLRSFWRGSGHVFVLITEIMQGYNGVNTYTTENSTIRVKLQEEAGGNASFYQATTDDISIHVEYDGLEGVSGKTQISTMEGGTLQLEPTQFYFGCSTIE